MDISNQRILVIGGSGLVGKAVCRKLISHPEQQPAAITITGRSSSKVEKTLDELKKLSTTTKFSGITGDIFCRSALKDMGRKTILSEQKTRELYIKDIIAPLNQEIVKESYLYQMIQKERPDIIIDSVNTATALAYQDVFSESRRLLKEIQTSKSAFDDKLFEEIETLIATQYTPQLVRHIQILWRALNDHHVKMYLKIGTTGTGGMGLNIPFTHSEDKPSRVLLAKSAMAGAHSMLLFILGRSANQERGHSHWNHDRNLKRMAPIIKEIKPAALIAWESIEFGEITHKGKTVKLVDHKPEHALDYKTSLKSETTPWQKTGETFKAPFIDTGENGIFSRFEFETLSEEGLMEIITPEDIANEVLQCLQGGNSGHDIVSALDSSILGPTFRGGYMRERALESLRYLEKKYGVPSIAFENLGPPKLAKLFYEIFIIEKHIKLLDPIEMDEKTLSERCVQTITEDSFLRQSSLAVGLAIVLPGDKLLRGEQLAIPSHWEYPEKGDVSLQQFNQFADKGWIDLRPSNMKVWIERLEQLQKEIAGPKEKNTHEKDDSSSNTIRNQRYWQQAVEKGEFGSFISWIFLKEDDGERIKN